MYVRVGHTQPTSGLQWQGTIELLGLASRLGTATALIRHPIPWFLSNIPGCRRRRCHTGPSSFAHGLEPCPKPTVSETDHRHNHRQRLRDPWMSYMLCCWSNVEGPHALQTGESGILPVDQKICILIHTYGNPYLSDPSGTDIFPQSPMDTDMSVDRPMDIYWDRCV